MYSNLSKFEYQSKVMYLKLNPCIWTMLQCVPTQVCKYINSSSLPRVNLSISVTQGMKTYLLQLELLFP